MSDKETRRVVHVAIGVVFSVGLGMNAFFIRRLVSQIDETQRITRQLQDDMIRIKERLGIAVRTEPYGPMPAHVQLQRGS